MAVTRCKNCGTFFEGASCSVCQTPIPPPETASDAGDTPVRVANKGLQANDTDQLLAELRRLNLQMNSITKILWSFWIVFVGIPIVLGIIILASS